MAKKDFGEVKSEVRKLVSEIIEVPEKDIDENASFTETLGVDSMMALEIVAAIEKKYQIVVPEKDIVLIRSMSDIYKLLERLMR